QRIYDTGLGVVSRDAGCSVEKCCSNHWHSSFEELHGRAGSFVLLGKDAPWAPSLAGARLSPLPGVVKRSAERNNGGVPCFFVLAKADIQHKDDHSFHSQRF